MFHIYPMNYLRALLPLLLIGYTFQINAQEISTEVHGKKAINFINNEPKLGGKVFQKSGDMIIGSGMADPLTYRRPERGVPDLLVTYNFGQKDSLMNSIEYEWNPEYFESEPKVQSPELQKALIKKYDSLVAMLNERLGKGMQKGDLSDLSKVSQSDGLSRSDSWKPNDTTYVSLYTMLRNGGEVRGYKKQPTYLIRLNISKVKKTAPELSDDAVDAAEKNYNAFIVELRAGNLEGARKYLSEQIRNLMTETIFNEIKGAVKPDAFKQYYRTLTNIKGANFLTIQFSYVNEGEEPTQVMNVLFDPAHLVIGIQPLARKSKSN